MKKKPSIIIALCVLSIIAITYFAPNIGNKDTVKTDSMVMQNEMQPSETNSNSAETNMDNQTKRYIDLAEFTANEAQYSNTQKVLFFHASWCPICNGIEEEIEADSSRIPTSTTLIKVDYDDNLELRKKHGVTYQYTFVQIDNDGNLVKKWSASSLEKVINEL